MFAGWKAVGIDFELDLLVYCVLLYGMRKEMDYLIFLPCSKHDLEGKASDGKG